MPDAEKLAAVREALPAVGAGIYLDTPVAGPLPAETARAVADLEGWELTTGRVGRDRRDEVVGRIDEARAAVAAILTTDVDAVELTHGLCDALRCAVAAVAWRPGDRIVVVEGERVVEIVVPAGVEQSVVELPSGDDAAILAAIESVIDDRTRLIAVPHVSAATGTLLPIERIARLIHAVGARLLVDGSLAAGAIPVAVDELGADWYAVPAQSWLLGPEGLGALVTVGRRGSGSAVAHEFHLPSVVGFARSAGWLSMYVGLGWIHDRGSQLTAHTAERLRAIDGVEVLTPADRQATTLVFRVAGWSAVTALEELGRRIFLLASSVPAVDAIRLGIGWFNTEAELDRLRDGVELLARHTPETLPPQRRLAILGQDA